MHNDKAARLIFLFGAAALLLQFPLVNLAARAELVWGLPPLLTYLFGCWLLIIVLTALVVNQPGRRWPGDDPNSV